MTTTQRDTAHPESEQPLALHIRSLRQWYGERGLEQAELAELAGISRHALHRLESSQEVPRSLEMLLSIAYALEVAPEDLLDPRRLARFKASIAERRENLSACQSCEK